MHSGGGSGRDGGPPSERETITTIEYTFQCARPRGNAKVKAFINAAYDWYGEGRGDGRFYFIRQAFCSRVDAQPDISLGFRGPPLAQTSTVLPITSSR